MDLIKALRGELNNCECHAYSRSECCCDTVWPEDVAGEAADEIESLRQQLAECERERDEARRKFAKYAGGVCEELAAVTAERDELVAALESISKNTCCGDCQEAKRVALTALAKLGAEKEE